VSAVFVVLAELVTLRLPDPQAAQAIAQKQGGS
jgi:hypothetical protein